MELVICNNGKATTTSIKVAEYFGKQHKNVIASIEKLLEDAEIKARLNFKPGSYMDANNQLRIRYDIDRDGFTLLAMGFTGKQALQFKLSYIDAFNAAEKALTTPAIPQDPILALVQAVQMSREKVLSLESGQHVLSVGLAETRHDVADLKANMKLENWQQNNIQKAVNHKVELWKELYPCLKVKKAYPAIYRHLKDKFNVPRYNEIPSVEYDKAITTVRNLNLNQLAGL